MAARLYNLLSLEREQEARMRWEEKIREKVYDFPVLHDYLIILQII